jgi:hypothetical protein
LLHALFMVNLHRTTRCHIPEDSTFHSDACENLRSKKCRQLFAARWVASPSTLKGYDFTKNTSRLLPSKSFPIHPSSNLKSYKNAVSSQSE